MIVTCGFLPFSQYPRDVMKNQKEKKRQDFFVAKVSATWPRLINKIVKKQKTPLSLFHKSLIF